MRKTKMMMLLSLSLLMQSCAGNASAVPETVPETTPAPTTTLSWPQGKLDKNDNDVPLLDVYVVEDEKVETIDVETYLQGVLAGEMKNDWPLEALKAQAILARTFVLKFIQEKDSKYPDADISTDIEEAQAYSAADVNDRIKQAVSETRGMVLSADGELPYAWFHAHSGGVTELASIGLGWNDPEPAYTQCTQSNEPETITDEADAQTLRDAQKWVATFPVESLESALASLGVEVTLTDSSKLTIGERGDSGRAATILVDGQAVDAAELRIALGSTEMRSTLLDTLSLRDSTVHMSGRGYGHGVGMSQWGAYGMAENGSTAEEIVTHYFRGVTLEKLW